MIRKIWRGKSGNTDSVIEAQLGDFEKLLGRWSRDVDADQRPKARCELVALLG